MDPFTGASRYVTAPQSGSAPPGSDARMSSPSPPMPTVTKIIPAVCIELVSSNLTDF
jgi:hypothetical protein